MSNGLHQLKLGQNCSKLAFCCCYSQVCVFVAAREIFVCVWLVDEQRFIQCNLAYNSFLDSTVESESLPCDDIEDCSGASDSDVVFRISCFFL